MFCSYLGRQYLGQALFMSGDAEGAIKSCEGAEETIDLSYCVSPVESHEDRKEEEGWAGAGNSQGDSSAKKPLQGEPSKT